MLGKVRSKRMSCDYALLEADQAALDDLFFIQPDLEAEAVACVCALMVVDVSTTRCLSRLASGAQSVYTRLGIQRWRPFGVSLPIRFAGEHHKDT